MPGYITNSKFWKMLRKSNLYRSQIHRNGLCLLAAVMIRGNDSLESFRISCSLLCVFFILIKTYLSTVARRRHYASFPKLKGLFLDSCKYRVTKSCVLQTVSYFTLARNSS